MNAPERFGALSRVTQALESLGVRYAVGGSIASAFYGVPRLTNDVDIVAELDKADVDDFAAALETEFYADVVAMRAAVLARRSFNVVSKADFSKVDVFVPPNGAWERLQFARARREQLVPEAESEPVLVATPEDTILAKLVWFEKGNRVSDRQWQDVRDVLEVQGVALDATYLRTWAAALRVGELLERAIAEADTSLV